MIARLFHTLFIERRVPYRLRGPLDRFLKALGSRYRKIQVDGLQFFVRRCADDELIVQRVVGEKEYFQSGFEISPSDVVVDIGANIGSFSVMAATRATQGKVFSFEPMPDNFALLQRNLEANGCRNAQPFCLGVLDQAGPVEFTLDSRTSGGHTIKHLKNSAGKITVQMTTLEAIIREHNIQRIDFLKIDCEGSEFPIFYQSNPQVFSIVRRLAMEYHIVCKQPEKGERAREFITFIESLGFRTVKHIDIPNAWEGLLFMERV